MVVDVEILHHQRYVDHKGEAKGCKVGVAQTGGDGNEGEEDLPGAVQRAVMLDNELVHAALFV